MTFLFIIVLVEVLVQVQSRLKFHDGTLSLPNNSFYVFQDVGSGEYALKCLTDSQTCCNHTNAGNWLDHQGRSIESQEYETSCLYVTRGDRKISLNREGNCSPSLLSSGLWRCDIPDSSGEIQSLYVYLNNANRFNSPPYQGQLNTSVIMNFTLHTDPRAIITPEFTISCLSRGGPATTVQWTVNGVSIDEDRDHETSQIILDTSNNPVYDNRLRVRGWDHGTYKCNIRSNIRNLFPTAPISGVSSSLLITGGGKPISLNASISWSTKTKNIEMFWELLAGPVIEYVIYYQPKGEHLSNLSVRVSGEPRKTYLLEDLHRGLTYNIFILTLSYHLPSPLSRPLTVHAIPLVVVETSPESLNVTANTQFSIICTARAEIDEERLDVDLHWFHIQTYPLSVETKVDPSLYTTTGSPESGYESVLTTSENDTLIIYRSIASFSYYSSSSDTIIIIEENNYCSDNIVTSIKLKTHTSTIIDITTTTTTIFDTRYYILPTSCNLNKFHTSINPSANSYHWFSNIQSYNNSSVIRTKPHTTIQQTSNSQSNFPTSSSSLPSTSYDCTCENAEPSNKDMDIELVAVTGAMVGGTILTLLITIMLFLIIRRSARQCKKVETHKNTAYGVVKVKREDPVYDVISVCPPTNTTSL